MIKQMQTNSRFIKEAYLHYPYFLNAAKKLTYNEMDAEDLVQETFARAFLFYHQYQEGTNCKGWLYSIMKNLFINQYRKRKLRATYFEAYKEEQKMVNLSIDPEMRKFEILKLMEKIKDEFRIVITLFHLEEYSLNEIAARLNWPLGTVKSRLHRARKELRKILEGNL